jgi:hypothetical protein
MRDTTKPTSVSGAQVISSIQEHNNLVKSVSKAMNELVIPSASHEPLENEVDMLAVDLLLLTIP